MFGDLAMNVLFNLQQYVPTWTRWTPNRLLLIVYEYLGLVDSAFRSLVVRCSTTYRPDLTHVVCVHLNTFCDHFTNTKYSLIKRRCSSRSINAHITCGKSPMIFLSRWSYHRHPFPPHPSTHAGCFALVFTGIYVIVIDAYK